MSLSAWQLHLERFVFGHRLLVVSFFLLVTIVMAFFAAQLRVDAGFSKLLPLEHEYMKTYVTHRQAFGGANRILIALRTQKGDIFTPEFFDLLKRITDDVFFIPGVDRTRVKSIFTPNVRFTEVVEDGIAAGNVIPANFRPTAEGLAQVRRNILKANIMGRLVANDFSAAIISAELMEFHPTTGEQLDYIDVSHTLEKQIREKYKTETEAGGYDIHIIGFAKVIGDIADGAARVVIFFGIAFIITALLVYIYTSSIKLTVIPLIASLMAVVWQLGLLTIFGYGIDPMGILVPFLVFAIGVSHGVQMVSATRAEFYDCVLGKEAACASFHKLLIPGGIALISDTIGFITILFIKIQIIQELAIAASLGVAVIILTNMFFVPVLLSFTHLDDRYLIKIQKRADKLKPYWKKMARLTEPGPASVVIIICAVLTVFGFWKATDVKIGDLHQGVPELRAGSQYNIDSRVVTNHFSIGVDSISVIVETVPEGCIDYDVMTTMDRFEWYMRNIQGVQSVVALAGIAKGLNAVLSRNQDVLVQAVSYVPTSSGLLNTDCSVMPVLIFTRDHKAETIERIVSAVKQFRKEHETEKIKFRLATGNVGVMAATNEEVAASQFPILIYVFSAIIVLCLITFRSFRAMLCIVLPLGLVSLLAYALMSMLEIGLKVSTLPVVALGVGVGVDYGIYIYSRLKSIMDEGESLQEAYRKTLAITGMSVLFTGLTLAFGVATWIFAPLKFQADMGILLTFMFVVNMLGAVLLLPALACVLIKSPKADIG
ncbi:MAG: MMPL family transporter [Deltaproteobacteria bacterium]|nr:MMPL family transporter [Deltaproteobacteria bacterium]